MKIKNVYVAWGKEGFTPTRAEQEAWMSAITEYALEVAADHDTRESLEEAIYEEMIENSGHHTTFCDDRIDAEDHMSDCMISVVIEEEGV